MTSVYRSIGHAAGTPGRLLALSSLAGLCVVRRILRLPQDWKALPKRSSDSGGAALAGAPRSVATSRTCAGDQPCRLPGQARCSARYYCRVRQTRPAAPVAMMDIEEDSHGADLSWAHHRLRPTADHRDDLVVSVVPGA